MGVLPPLSGGFCWKNYDKPWDLEYPFLDMSLELDGISAMDINKIHKLCLMYSSPIAPGIVDGP